jgi:molybdopterin converting factor small subunit
VGLPRVEELQDSRTRNSGGACRVGTIVFLTSPLGFVDIVATAVRTFTILTVQGDVGERKRILVPTISVRLPTVLRPAAGGLSAVEASGDTVGDVVLSLISTYPGLEANLVDGEGGVRRFVNVYVNDEDIRFLDMLDTKVTAGDEVAILPAVAGG